MKYKVPSLKMWRKIYKVVPRLCVDLIIKDKKGVVLAKRDIGPEKGKWHIIGGNLLYGETIEHAIKRKAKEETGLKVKVIKFLGVYQYDRKYTYGHTISLVFLCKPMSGKLRGYKYGKEVKFFKKIPKLGFKQNEILQGKLIR